MTAFAGENTKNIWENKICVHEIPACRLDNAKRDGKPVVLYDISAASFIQGRALALQKLKKTLGFFEEKHEDITLMWRRNTVTEDVLSALEPEIYKQYQEMVDEYK